VNGPAGSQRPPVPQRKGSLLRTIRAVAWSFIGLRKGSEYRQDLEKINPIHVVIVGLLAAFLFVAALIALVRWIA